jgi:hypothetical protein
MSEIITKGEYARRRGVSDQCVSMWIARRQLTTPALKADGTVDVALADEQLRERLDPARSSTCFGQPDLDDAGPQAARSDLLDRERRQRIEEREIRLARLRREELAARGVYVRAADVRRSHNQMLAQLIAAMDQFVIGDLPTRFGFTNELRAEIRKEWRAFRERQAEHYASEAAVLPEFIIHGRPETERGK